MVASCFWDPLEEQMLDVLLHHSEALRSVSKSIGVALGRPACVVGGLNAVHLSCWNGLFFLEAPHVVDLVVHLSLDSLIFRVDQERPARLEEVADEVQVVPNEIIKQYFQILQGYAGLDQAELGQLRDVADVLDLGLDLDHIITIL